MNTAAAAGQAGFAAALLDASLPCPPGLKAWNGSDPAARFAVHRNNVVCSLVDALAETFPVVQALVGEDFFRAMAREFVAAHPPRTRVLAHYGDELAGFVERFAPARGLPWLADVARLEHARVRAFHAADTPALGPAGLAAALAAGGDDAGALRLACHPSVGVVDSAHAVVSLWAAHQGDDPGAALVAVDCDAPEAALVVRAGLDVLVLRLPPGAAAFVAALQGGEDLAGAASHGEAAAGCFDLAAALALLVAHAAIAAPQNGGPP